MKNILKAIATLTVFLTSITAHAQTPARLKFLGIPVDGNKTEMIQQLKLKGFVYNSKEDILTGTFNGMDSSIRIHENNKKVDRILICDQTIYDEAQIRIQFNELLQQFKNNKKYIELETNSTISETENISYEMIIRNKTYNASFFLNPTYDFTEEDKTKLLDEIEKEFQTKNETNQCQNLTKQETNEIKQSLLEQKLFQMIQGQVWFTIINNYRGYYLAIYYDNLNNRPNGEDL